ncbi:MAG TPA: cell envelope biogenesis protein TolA, partial [Aggregicoccus sp.]|nr:cell envelope biogenesis protein TolA [Aggregicoccus sp.]
MLVALLILMTLGFAVTLGMLLFGNKRAGGPAIAHTRTPQLESESKARAQAEAELERKRRELEEQRAQLNELKSQLKDAKRKLFEQKDSDKGDRDLLRARAEVERNASQQLELVRADLATALAEIDRLKAQSEGGRPRRAPAPAAAPAPLSAVPPAAPAAAAEAPAASDLPAAPVAAAPAPKRFRELTDADRERMERLEHTAN